MRMVLWLALIAGIALWALALQRELATARKHCAMYREAAARMERRLDELKQSLPS
ncbi:hypothetical protein [Roseiflexus castenholzii]|jgi:type IV secretory pathway TrbD component|uniref:hypothetical protein n=1 Tax=Roseiflexus castenholzii TaxID=120962 RepID=UPI0002E6B6AF|nr:hypothetical protein [Roseiflexus castenholzii]